MKKLIVVLIFATLTLSACSNDSNDVATSKTSIQTSSNSATAANKQPMITQKPVETQAPKPTIEDAVSQIEVSYEKYSNKFSEYGIIYVTNHSDFVVDYTVNVDLYNGDELVGTTSTGSEALEPGVTYAWYVMNDEKFDKLEHSVSIQESIYDGVVSKLKLDVKTTENKAIISVTNNGDITAKFVKYMAIFYNKGEIVGFDWGYTVDKNSQLLSGKTERAEAKYMVKRLMM